MDWIDINTQKPKNFDDIYVKTDCPDCPINPAMWYKDRVVMPCLCQCDHHFSGLIDFVYLGLAGEKDYELFQKRITHWMPNTKIYDKIKEKLTQTKDKHE
jgi:hypothetical protein